MSGEQKVVSSWLLIIFATHGHSIQYYEFCYKKVMFLALPIN